MQRIPWDFISSLYEKDLVRMFWMWFNPSLHIPWFSLSVVDLLEEQSIRSLCLHKKMVHHGKIVEDRDSEVTFKKQAFSGGKDNAPRNLFYPCISMPCSWRCYETLRNVRKNGYVKLVNAFIFMLEFRFSSTEKFTGRPYRHFLAFHECCIQ